MFDPRTAGGHRAAPTEPEPDLDIEPEHLPEPRPEIPDPGLCVDTPWTFEEEE